MQNRARNRVKLFPESNSFGIIAKKSKTIFCSNSLLGPQSIRSLEKLKFATLCLEIRDLPTICLSCFLRPIYNYFQRQKLLCGVSGPQIEYKKLFVQTIQRRTVLYCTNYSDPYPQRNPVYSILVVQKLCPRLFYHRQQLITN